MNGLPFRTTAVLFGFAFLGAASYVLTTALGVSLYLARVGANSLPLVLVASAIAVVIVSSLTYSLTVWLSAKRCIVSAWSLLAIVSFVIALQLKTSDHSVYLLGTIYVLSEIRGCFNTVFLTTVMTSAFGENRSKRPYAIVSAGAPVAGILTGLILHYEASVVTEVQMMQIVAGLDVAVVVLFAVIGVSHRRPSGEDVLDESNAATIEPESSVESETPTEPTEQSNFDNYRFYLGALLVFKTVVLTLIGYQWKCSVSGYLHENETALIAFFAAYYAVTDVMILFTQFFLSGRLLDRYGIRLALIGYPCLLLGLGLVSLGMESKYGWFVLLTVIRGADVIRRSLHDPSLVAAFAFMHEELRRRSIIFIRGILKPIAEVSTALVLLLFVDGTRFEALVNYWWLISVLWLSAAWMVTYLHRRWDVIR